MGTNALTNPEYPNLRTHEAPPLLRKIYQFMYSDKGRGCGLELPSERYSSSKQKVADFVGPELAEAIIPIFQLGHGSLIGVWLREPDGNLENSPVVWLDSEGDPTEVFANSLAELCGMLHYYDGTVYDIIKSAMRHLERPQMFGHPMERFPTQELQEKVNKFWDRNPQLQHLHEFLEGELGIPMDLAIPATILAALGNHPRLSKLVVF